MRDKSKLVYGIVLLFILNIVIIGLFQTAPAAEAATYRRGSSGAVVRKVQQRLKDWGYYKGAVDGIYGSKTVAAVKYFQKKHGLSADGICGPRTLSAIGVSGGSSSGVSGSRNNDLYLLARIISAESRGEPYIGQIAVGAVIMNRVQHPSFPNTISGVIYQPGAFTAVTDGQFNKPVTPAARRAAQEALNGYDPSGGAIYYYNPAKTTSKWIYSRPVIKKIGTHIFAR
ncbi:MAG: spore cortex-lytic enzyme [Bacillota bacterium]|nr:spore cortex-lytic enzyme [Bacillota bacterium]